jgi:hypothetical protein
MRQLPVVARHGSLGLLLCAFAASACGASPADAPSDGDGGKGESGQGGAGKGGSGGSAPASGGMGMTSTGGTAGMASPGGLPVVVTMVFNNQGWFADPSVSAQFKPGSTIIKQSESIAGPCSMRDPSARGKCLKVVYTPPQGTTLQPTGFVGVFFLTTLAKDHAETVPPAKIGDANWGAEPGAAVPAGAKSISFLASAEVDGVTVVFKAGTDKDAFVVPETPTPLSTTWKRNTLSLEGKSYGASVIGGFAWVLLDTSKAATFYLDDIVWE